MKKMLVKAVGFLITFVVALVVINRIMNQGHDNMTIEMSPATFPIVTMEKSGEAYNELHGYGAVMDTAFQRDTITVLGENRETGFTVDTYGRDVTAIRIEVRSTDGSRLIENTPVTDYQRDRNLIHAQIALKDLIEKDTEYALVIVLELEGEESIRYYTRVIWGDALYFEEKLAFVKDFHQRLYDKEAARALTRYLETNPRLEDNTSFHKVNIHSSFRQITWGDLPIREIGQPVVRLEGITGQTASFIVDYMVATSEESETYYMAEEYFRVRYTPERMYLLDYERTMTQVPDVGKMYANDKILLGIVDPEVPMLESEDGNSVVFVVANRLLSYDITANKLTVIFSFYDAENMDARTVYDCHGIKILDVDEGGNVSFAVYGYMNRGRHEGEVGIQVYAYNNTLNTIEEVVYIPYNKTYSVLRAEMQQLLYLNRNQKLYFWLENTVYEVDLVERTWKEMVDISQDGSLEVSDNHKIVVWQEGSDIYQCTQLNVRNLNDETQSTISVGAGDALRPLGFMGEDIIYGVARRSDIIEEHSGRILFPMYRICICNSDGKLLKEYSRENIYVTGCRVEDNQITLERVELQENGSYQEIDSDHIMNTSEEAATRNVVVTADIDVYERYVEIQMRSTIDSKTIKVLNPKEVVFEGGRELALEVNGDTARYYVYDLYGVSGIYNTPSFAIHQAYETSGVVVNNTGNYIWVRGNRVNRNQIMAITAVNATQEKGSLAVCLDTMLKLEGIIRNSEYLLGQGQTAMEILSNNLENALALDLNGCSLDAVLYYVNQDIPVLALLENGEAVLVTGFNETQVVILEPSSGTLYKKGMSDASEWFAENGNRFVTYIRRD